MSSRAEARQPSVLRLVLEDARFKSISAQRGLGGIIRIRLLPNLSPESVRYIKRVVALYTTDGNRFHRGCSSNEPLAGANGPLCLYRMEGVPPPGTVDGDGNPGPPYALIQGRLAHAGARGVPASAVRSAKKPKLQAGDVAWAGGGTGPDFFISLAPHPEWGNGHVVWGRVENMASLDRLRAEPRVQQSWGNVRVSLFARPVPFKPAII